MTEETPKEVHLAQRAAIYARVSLREHRANLERQIERLEGYCAAKGYQIAAEVREVALGVHDARQKFLALLKERPNHHIDFRRASVSRYPVWVPLSGNLTGNARAML